MDDEKNVAKLELARTLVRGGKSVTAAAQIAGIGRSTLYRYLEKVPSAATVPACWERENKADFVPKSSGECQFFRHTLRRACVIGENRDGHQAP
jgi:transposase-like protein